MPRPEHDEFDAERAERAVREDLVRLGADFELRRIDPAFANTAEFCARYGYSLDSSINCIVVAGKTTPAKHAACMVPANRRLDVNGTVRRLLGVRKASFAPPEATVALTGMVPDGVTPFGLPADLPLYIDPRVLDFERVIVGGGSRAMKVLVRPDALTRRPGAQVIAGLTRPA